MQKRKKVFECWKLTQQNFMLNFYFSVDALVWRQKATHENKNAERSVEFS